MLNGRSFVCASQARKNQVHTVEWDASLDELKREKESAEAIWDKPNQGSSPCQGEKRVVPNAFLASSITSLQGNGQC
ncbi:hypothetical protein M422DRAFT_249058 [Sphaerobolus stellatus SS14]|nr:hypothetical protein M422DRAFT_249058 [Sphaerobolus stellatus SS14]